MLGLSSCQKDIDINQELHFESMLFIEGLLSPGETPKIFISESQPFFSPELSPQDVFARGAIVSISQGGNTEVLNPDSLFNHFRCRYEPYYGGNTPVEFAKTYQLNVNYKGKDYSASTSITQSKVDIKSIEYVTEFFDVYGGHDGVAIKLDDAVGEQNNYRFRMDRMIDNGVGHAVFEVLDRSCHGEDELYPVSDIGRIVFNDNNNDGQELELLIEVAFEYEKDDSTWVFIQSMDAKSAAFYSELDQQLQSIQNPFVEPVFINSQIEGAFGVFGSTVLSDSVLFVYPVTGD